MRLPDDIQDAVVGPEVHEIDARWLMAYAAALGETGAAYTDPGHPAGLLAHPLFPVCYEWPLTLALRARLPSEVAARAVHATHALMLHRLPRPGDRLATTVRVVSVAPRPAGVLVVTRFETVDRDRAPVSLTDHGSVYRGVAWERAGSGPPAYPALASAPGPPAWVQSVPVAAGLAHIYSECARIWNPIHTDRVAARRAGLPDVILHGTATLALAVSAVLRHEPGGDPQAVRRIMGRFGAMVRVPSTLIIEGWEARETEDGRWVAFVALTEAGDPAVRDGRLLLGPAEAGSVAP